MIIPGLSTLKTWVLALLGIAVSILYALFQHEKLARTKDKLKEAVESRKQVKNALDVKNAVDDMSDDAVSNELHKFDRD